MKRSKPLLLSLLLCLSAAGCGGGPAAAASDSASPVAARSLGAPPERWGGLPPAALAPEPSLPEADGWNFGDGFPRTSGSGRYFNGAYFWSDFLYDDRGAASPGSLALLKNRAYGGYRYPEAAAASNGADLFRAAVGLESDASVWRVDWNTLIDPALPIAAFALDVDANPVTGVTAWPANARLKSAGIDYTILLSNKGAQLIDTRSGVTTPLPVTVDAQARSFLVRVPHSLLPLSGRSTLWLAAGLANSAGAAFKTLDAAHGAAPGQPNVYNLAFRDYADEPQYVELPGLDGTVTTAANFWFEYRQAEKLGVNGEATPFSVTVDWARLAVRDNEPEPVVKGLFSNRWFVSSIEPGQGIQTVAGNADSTAAGLGGTSIYGNRVQPYAIYVPTTYTGEAPAALTLVLHASSFNHNTERLISPRFTQGACEDRGSICVSPLGRGETLYWLGFAELDFWEVWNRVATAFHLDPERTIIGGHSGGGSGTFNFVQDRPELFAAFYIINSLDGSVEPETNLYLDLAENLRWNPMYHMDTALDELPPILVAPLEIQRFEELGYRYVYDIHLIEEHFTPAIKDDYRNLIAWLNTVGTRKHQPGHLSYRWYPQTVDREHGFGAMGAWWLQDVDARDAKVVARIDAVSAANPEPTVTPVVSTEPNLLGGPSPALRRRLDWQIEDTLPPRETVIELELVNVGAVTIDLAGAGFLLGETGVIIVNTDGPVALRLPGAQPSSVTLEAGEHRVAVCG